VANSTLKNGVAAVTTESVIVVCDEGFSSIHGLNYTISCDATETSASQWNRDPAMCGHAFQVEITWDTLTLANWNSNMQSGIQQLVDAYIRDVSLDDPGNEVLINAEQGPSGYLTVTCVMVFDSMEVRDLVENEFVRNLYSDLQDTFPEFSNPSVAFSTPGYTQTVLSPSHFSGPSIILLLVSTCIT
jgi:hypothetical protein